MKKSTSYLLRRALANWGNQLQTLVAIEEMSELTKALIKHERAEVKSSDNYKNIQEEIADVQIMLWQLMLIYDKIAVNECIEHKLQRLAKNLNMDINLLKDLEDY